MLKYLPLKATGCSYYPRPLKILVAARAVGHGLNLVFALGQTFMEIIQSLLECRDVDTIDSRLAEFDLALLPAGRTKIYPRKRFSYDWSAGPLPVLPDALVRDHFGPRWRPTPGQ